ncbi:hypothetical protein DF153_21480 [Burkholderia cenocepacia]|nr:hypothetical protein DF152_12540 [Burkholderia cenocepacia]RQU21075.1 hypothetical protein DF153_21480 [Burkholderia cenocepacia]
MLVSDIVEKLEQELIGGVVEIKPERLQRGKMPPDPEWPMTALRVGRDRNGLPIVQCCYMSSSSQTILPFSAPWDVIQTHEPAASVSREVGSFKKGDKVMLKSGSLIMDVEHIHPAGITCSWQPEMRPVRESALVSAIALRKVE